MRQYNNYKELFDSDDELPFEYNDIYVRPAFENDSRFERINFKWIKTPKITSNPQPIVRRGVMSEQDMYCLKSVQGFVGNSTLVWLLNFLLHKDLQSDYTFLKSCLVSNIV